MPDPTKPYDRDAMIAFAKDRASIKEQAKHAADAVLENTWDTDVYPVDPYTIASKLNVDVLHAQIAGDVSGILRKRPLEKPQIYIDSDDSRNRQRFTCAHELGHYVQREQSGGIEEADVSFIDRRGDLATQGNDLREIFANEFAANLLMPEVAVRSLRSLDMKIPELARFFSVSPISMEYRLQNLGIR
ncbi:MAG: ImmA/IrrE family metallo-endopeptidase [Rhodococcus sp.]|nr:ImmA/IrrE family metallo-endopeptidase [Rhodococcus sp. (in: high G+C Gram-positive bacteria)]